VFAFASTSRPPVPGEVMPESPAEPAGEPAPPAFAVVPEAPAEPAPSEGMAAAFAAPVGPAPVPPLALAVVAAVLPPAPVPKVVNASKLPPCLRPCAMCRETDRQPTVYCIDASTFLLPSLTRAISFRTERARCVKATSKSYERYEIDITSSVTPGEPARRNGRLPSRAGAVRGQGVSVAPGQATSCAPTSARARSAGPAQVPAWPPAHCEGLGD